MIYLENTEITPYLGDTPLVTLYLGDQVVCEISGLIPLLSISGSVGLVLDQASGSLSNSNTLNPTYTDNKGLTQTSLDDEIRLDGSRRLENIYRNVFFNASISPAPDGVGGDSDIEYTKTLLTTSNSSRFVASFFSKPIGTDVSLSFEIKADDPSNIGKHIRIELKDSSFSNILYPSTAIPLKLGLDYVRHEFSSVVPLSASGDFQMWLYGFSKGSRLPSTGFIIKNIQVCDTTDQSPNRTNEYIGSNSIGNVGVEGLISSNKTSGLYSNVSVYGDSFVADSFGIGTSCNSFCGVDIRVVGNSGFKLVGIRGVLEADQPFAGDKLVVIQGGINDLVTATGSTVDDMKVQTQGMVDYCLANSLLPLVLTVSPWKDQVDWDLTKQGYTEEYNSWVISNFIDYVDIYPILASTSDIRELHTDFDNGDKLHPNIDGYNIIDRAIAEKIVSLNINNSPLLSPSPTILLDSNDNLSIPLSLNTNINDSEGAILLRFIPGYNSSDGGNNGFVSIRDSTTDDILYSQLSSRLASNDGATNVTQSPVWSIGDDVIVSLVWSSSENKKEISTSLDGGSSWLAWTSGSYDGTLSPTDTVLKFLKNVLSESNLKSVLIYGGLEGGTILSAESWIETNASVLTS